MRIIREVDKMSVCSEKWRILVASEQGGFFWRTTQPLIFTLGTVFLWKAQRNTEVVAGNAIVVLERVALKIQPQ